MAKLSSDEIIKLLEVLIGSTDAVGETNMDNKIMENIKR